MIRKIYHHLRDCHFKRIQNQVLDTLWNDYTKDIELKELSTAQIKEIQEYWEPLVGRRVNTKWHKLLYSLTGVFTPRYEPFEICAYVQDNLSPNVIQRLFDDKGLYRQLLYGFCFPKRVAECINGVFYLPVSKGSIEVNKDEFLAGIQNIKRCIIKPSKGTDGGRGVSSIDVVDGVVVSTNMDIKSYIEEYIIKYGCNFCIEEKIQECENLQILNSSSCNSLRVHTYRDRDAQEIKFISSYIRIGRRGKVVDNAHSGGLCAKIYDGGYLKMAVTAYPYKIYYKTDDGVELDGYKIESFDKIIETVMRAHSNLPMFDLIGWDVVMDRQGNVVIIEFNPNPDLRIEQCIFGDSCLLGQQETILQRVYCK